MEIPLVIQRDGARPKMDVPRWAYMPPQRTAAAFSEAHSGLSESGRADTQGFLRELLLILPLLGVRVFEKPTPEASPGKAAGKAPSEN